MAVLAWMVLVGTPTVPAAGVVTNCTSAALLRALQGGGVVLLACDGQITLTNTVTISVDTTIEATNRVTAISGVGGTNGTRLLLVEPGVRLTLKNLSLRNGRVNGRSGGRGEAGERAAGAAIYNQGGVVTLENVIVSGHVASGGGGGLGADHLGGGSSGQPGRPGGAALGAAIFNDGGIFSASNVVFQANTGTAGVGGAGGVGGTGGNGGFGGDGGAGGVAGGAAFYNSPTGTATFMDCAFATNRVEGAAGGLGGAGGGGLGFPGDPGAAGGGLGAAVHNNGGELAISHCTFNHNSAVGAGGIDGGTGAGFETPGLDGATGGRAWGGGVYSNGGAVTLTNVTFFQNTLVGGAGGDGGGGSSGGFGGDGGEGGAGGAALGGGLALEGTAVVAVVNGTFAEHTLTGGVGGAGGAAGSGVARGGATGATGVVAGGAIHTSGASVTVRNSIFEATTKGGLLSGTVADAGFNLLADASLEVNAGSGTRTNTPALLGGFGDNGGPTFTVALAANSPAINGITIAGGNGCPPADQRHATRNDLCDIGAFELGGSLRSIVLTVLPQVIGGAIIVTWPVTSASFQVESTAALPPNWATLTNVVVTSGSTNFVNVITATPQRFFRLRKL